MNFKSTPLFENTTRRVREVGRRVVGWQEVFSHESARSFQAVLESADYADEHMKGAFVSDSSREVLLHSLERAPKEGLVLEFGAVEQLT